MWISNSLSSRSFSFRFTIKYPIRFCFRTELDHSIVVHRVLNKCDLCQTEITNVKQEFKFTRPVCCKGQNCKNRTRFSLDADAPTSIFGDWQRIRIQESEADIPAGSMPRTLDVIVRDEIFEDMIHYRPKC